MIKFRKMLINSESTAVELAEFQVMEKDNSPPNQIRESKFVSSMMSPISELFKIDQYFKSEVARQEEKVQNH